MINLLPVENWDYGFKDLFYGLNKAIYKNKKHITLHLDKIGNCIPIRSGRGAIFAAIKALALKPAAKIAVPLYSCPVVFKAVTEAGATPVFIDIERDTFCLSVKDLRHKIDQVDAIIAIHMFGNLCDMSALLNTAQGKPVIEDCAQSLGSKYNGQMAGTMGAVGIFSFRSGKYLSVGEGGALYANAPEIVSRLAHIVDTMKIPQKTEQVMHVLKTYVRSRLRSRPLYGLIGEKMWKIYNKTVDYSAKTPIILSKIFYSDLCLAGKRLATFENVIEIQRANAEYYAKNLELKPDMQCSEKPNTFYNRYAYPIIFPSTNRRDFVATYLYKKQIGTIKPYNDIKEIAATYYDYRGDCPVTEDISKRILLIPSHYALKKKDLEKITKCLNATCKITG